MDKQRQNKILDCPHVLMLGDAHGIQQCADCGVLMKYGKILTKNKSKFSVIAQYRADHHSNESH